MRGAQPVLGRAALALAAALLATSAGGSSTYEFCTKKLVEDEEHAFCLGYRQGFTEAWQYLNAQAQAEARRRVGSTYSTEPPAPMTSRSIDLSPQGELIE
ncbi:MAG: hypothetical protein AAGF44_11910 [Pseudomonadota bacterium]